MYVSYSSVYIVGQSILHRTCVLCQYVFHCLNC